VHQGIINNVTSILTKASLGLSGIIIALVRGWQMALVMISFLPIMMASGFIGSYYMKKIEKFQQKTRARFDA
jgi:ABC-type multidrug transport system fused ATPase/permease subunit